MSTFRDEPSAWINDELLVKNKGDELKLCLPDGEDCLYLDVEDARKLRDYLNRALPPEFSGRVTVLCHSCGRIHYAGQPCPEAKG